MMMYWHYLETLFFRRKSSLPKFDPPPGYAKRQMMKGYSHHNSPHCHITPGNENDNLYTHI